MSIWFGASFLVVWIMGILVAPYENCKIFLHAFNT
nr:MAG TPA: hypothetical protein [Caudoviricetes sp.]